MKRPRNGTCPIIASTHMAQAPAWCTPSFKVYHEWPSPYSPWCCRSFFHDWCIKGDWRSSYRPNTNGGFPSI